MRSTPAPDSKAAHPPEGYSIGAKTYQQLPTGTIAAPRTGLILKGKNNPVDAYLLQMLPTESQAPMP